MHRFMSSLASSSSGRAEQPASASSSSLLRSAEQPATPSHLKILSIRDVQHWLADESIASCSSADVQRIREAAAVLSHPKPRQQDVRALQSEWNVAQTNDKTPRPLADVVQEFRSKVVEAAQNLHRSRGLVTPSHLKILSIRDVQRWLDLEPIASLRSAEVQRIREAAAVLSHPNAFR